MRRMGPGKRSPRLDSRNQSCPQHCPSSWDGRDSHDTGLSGSCERGVISVLLVVPETGTAREGRIASRPADHQHLIGTLRHQSSDCKKLSDGEKGHKW